MACLLEMPSQHSLLEVVVPLAGDDSCRPFPDIMKEFLSVGRLPDKVNEFGLSIIAYTLYRLVIPELSEPVLIKECVLTLRQLSLGP
jgi:hypothetical protein